MATKLTESAKVISDMLPAVTCRGPFLLPRQAGTPLQVYLHTCVVTCNAKTRCMHGRAAA